MTKKIGYTPITIPAHSQVRINVLYTEAVQRFCRSDLENDAPIHHAGLFIGGREFYGGTTGLELYHLTGTHRHSLGVVEWQANGGYKVIFHYVGPTMPKSLEGNLCELFQATFLTALFPKVALFERRGVICVQFERSWVPTLINSKTNKKHFVLLNSPDIVDNPSYHPVVGTASPRVDHWHTRFVQIPPTPAPTSRISELARRETEIVVTNQDGKFDPDSEVAGIPGEEL